MISIEQLRNMLALQHQLNSKIHPQWHAQKFPWPDAIMVEGTEALDHYGWKWWKQQLPDLPQVRIELVDIWHFALSIFLEKNTVDVQRAADDLLRCLTLACVPNRATHASARENLRAIVGAAASGKGHFNGNAFVALLHATELSWDRLYKTYIAKNVLNVFRQDHGYKDGTYQKMWGGQEDNVILEQLMALKPDATPEQLYAKLASVYANIFTLA